MVTSLLGKSGVQAACAVVLMLVVTVGSAHGAPGRIVSLAPQLTEMLYALGVEDRIVAVTTFCDYPPAAAAKPKIGGMSNPSVEAIVAMRPDLVLLTTDGNPREVEQRLSALGLSTYVFRARRIRELPDAIRNLGGAVGAGDEAARLAETLEVQLSRFDEQRRARTNQPSDRAPRVLFVIWPEPLVVAGPGTGVDDALQLIGLQNLAGVAGVPYPKYSVEEVLTGHPDAIFIGTMNKNMESIRDATAKFVGRLGNLGVVREGRIYFTGDALYRLGPRFLDGVRELETLMYGEEP